MDALPVTEQTGLPFASKATSTYRGETVGVMHACGHDAHTATLLGVADALVKMRANLPGEVMLIIVAAIQAAIAETGATTPADIGKLMGALKPRLAGQADMGLVSKLVKQQLAG